MNINIMIGALVEGQIFHFNRSLGVGSLNLYPNTTPIVPCIVFLSFERHLKFSGTRFYIHQILTVVMVAKAG